MRPSRAPAHPLPKTESPRGDLNSHARVGLELLKLARLPFRHPAIHRICSLLRYQHILSSSGRSIRTSAVRFKAGEPTASRSPRVPRGGRTRLSGLVNRCLAARPGAQLTQILRAEGEGVEPPKLIARPLSRRLPSPVGLPFHAARVGAAGFEPAVSWSQTRRISQTFLRPDDPGLPSSLRTRSAGRPSGTRGARTLNCPVKSRVLCHLSLGPRLSQSLLCSRLGRSRTSISRLSAGCSPAELRAVAPGPHRAWSVLVLVLVLWVGWRSNPRPRRFKPLLIRLSYRPIESGLGRRLAPSPANRRWFVSSPR